MCMTRHILRLQDIGHNSTTEETFGDPTYCRNNENCLATGGQFQRVFMT